MAERVQALAQARELRRIVWLLGILEVLAAARGLPPISSPGFQPNLNPFDQERAGKALSALVNQLRVGRACWLLAETDLAVIEIAIQCGFENLSNFNRQFLRQMRRTPHDYHQVMVKTR